MKDKYDFYEIIEDGEFEKKYKVKLKNTDELKVMKIIDKKKYLDDFGEDYYKNKLLKSYEYMEICFKDNVNSVKLYEYCDTEKEFIGVTELVDENLSEFLKKRDQGLNPQEILGILKQLNNTFKIMVNNLIVHRGIKLDSIYIKYKNNEKFEYIVKIGDYGFSTKLNPSDLKVDFTVNTMIYLAPKVLEDLRYDGKVDLWSLGVSIYVLLFKEFPNKVKDAASQKLVKTSGNELLDDLLKKLLVKDPANRITWEQYFEPPFFK